MHFCHKIIYKLETDYSHLANTISYTCLYFCFFSQFAFMITDAIPFIAVLMFWYIFVYRIWVWTIYRFWSKTNYYNSVRFWYLLQSRYFNQCSNCAAFRSEFFCITLSVNTESSDVACPVLYLVYMMLCI